MIRLRYINNTSGRSPAGCRPDDAYSGLDRDKGKLLLGSPIIFVTRETKRDIIFSFAEQFLLLSGKQ